MVPRQKRYPVKSLQMSALLVVLPRLRGWERRSITVASEDLMRIIVDFRAFADPIFHLLVEYTSFDNWWKLRFLFLSEFVKEKKMILDRRYSTQIVDLIVDLELFETEKLRTVTELCIEKSSSYKLDELFSKFPNLQKLRISRGLKDDTLESIANHFPELTVLDGLRDPFFNMTDLGLLKLARLKKLRYLLFNPDFDEQNCRTITGRGLAFLVTQLPELVKVSYPGFILCDCLNVLHLSKSRLLTVKSLDFGMSNLGINNLIAAINVCPNLERLRIYVRMPEHAMNSKRLNFSKLAELHVDEIFTLWNAPAFFEFKSVWRQLRVLYLDVLSLELEHMLILSENCPNVKFLSLGGECPDQTLSLEVCLGRTWPLLFPRLETLELFSGELCNLYLFLHKNSNLVKVAITGHDNEVIVLESLKPDHGFWPKVETVSITILDCNEEEVYDEEDTLSRHLVEAFPSLKQICVCIERDEEGVILTSSQGNDVTLCSNVSFKLFSKDPELDYLDCLKME